MKYLRQHYFLVLGLLISQIVNAQWQRPSPDQLPSFAVSPTQLQLTGRPGQILKKNIKLVTRNYRKPVNFTVAKMDLGQEDGNASTPVEFYRGTRSCSQWMDISEQIVAGGNDQVEIPLTVRIPPDAKGSYFGYINITTDPERPEGQFAVVVKYQLPIKIELNIPGQALLRINASDFSYRAKSSTSNASVRFKLFNEGLWKSSIEGDIIIRNNATREQIIVPIPYAASGNPYVIYPGLKIPVVCSMTEPLGNGSYAADLRLLMNGFAKAQFHFEFSIGGGAQTLANLREKEEFDLNLEVAPYIIEMPMRPGAKRHIPIRITNRNELPVKVNLTLRNATIGTNGAFIYQNENSVLNKNQNSWIDLSEKELTIESKRTGIVRTEIVVPEDFKESFDAMKVVQIQAIRVQEKTGTEQEWGSVGESTIPILVYDALAENPKLECSKFEIVRAAKEKNPTAGIIRLKNTGKKIAKIRGRISLSKAEREFAYREIGFPQPELILPGYEREFRIEIPPLEEGEFTVAAELKFDKERNKVALYEDRSFTAVAAMPNELR